jgi:hypothetical protein
MRVAQSSPLANVLVWFGVLGAPLAWAAQLVLGYGVTEAACGAGGARWGIDTTQWEIALTAATAALALASGLAAWRVLRDPRGSFRFLATWGVLESLIFVVLILLGGIGSFYLSPCHQG